MKGWHLPVGTAARVQATERAWSSLRALTQTCGPETRLETVAAARGTCPSCGYWNHPKATAYEHGDLVYCNNCGHTWTAKESDGPEASR